MIVEDPLKKTRTLQTASVLLLFVLASALFIYEVTRSQQSLHYSSIINTAGKQRMLSQRISYLQHVIVTDIGSSEAQVWREETLELINEFEQNHLRLSAQAPYYEDFTIVLTEPLNALYFDSTPSLNQEVNEFVSTSRKIIQPQGRSYTFYSPSQSTQLLKLLDTATTLFEKAAMAQEKAERWSNIVTIILLLALALLLARLSLRPLTVKVAQQEQANNEIKGELSVAKRNVEAQEQKQKQYIDKITHDLRSPISAIISILELLPNSKSEAKNLIRQAEVACHRLLKYTEDLADMIKPRADIGTKRDFDLIGLLDNSISKAANDSEIKGLSFTVDSDETLPKAVLGYPRAIRKSLENVLLNAVNFTQEGGVSVKFEVAGSNDSFSLITTVSDTGKGIPTQNQDKIFTRFAQLFDENGEPSGTAGVGLSIAKECIEDIGGSITLNSSIGSGSTFIMHFPISKAATSGQYVKRKTTSEVKFAIIDDILISRQHLSNLVNSAGYSCDLYHSSSNFFENKDKIKEYTGLIVDYYMPGLNGEELVNTLQAMLGKDMPTVIMVSSSPDIANLVAHSSIKAWQVFSKPLMESRFIDALHKLTQSAGEPSSQRTASILVVEDEPINAEMMVHMLTSLGYSARVAPNGQTALALCRSIRFDCILLDIHLPDMDGVTVAKRLKAQSIHTPIIVVSGDTAEDTEEMAKNAGVRYYLFKPVPFQELRNTVEFVLTD